MTSTPSRVAAETALILCLAAGPLAFGAVEPWSEALVFLLVAAGFFAVMRGSVPVPSRSQAALIGAFSFLALYAFIQSLNPVDPTGPVPVLPHTVSRSDSLTAAFRFSACAAAAWLSCAVTKERANLVRFSWAVLSIGAVIALIGLLQLADGNSRLYGVRWYQSGVNPFGPFYNRNHAAALLSLSCFAGVGILLDRAAHRRDATPRLSAADFVAAQGLVVFLVLMVLIGLVATGSRAAVAAVGAAAALWALSTRGGRFVAAGSAVLFIGLGLAVSAAKGGLASSVAQRASIYSSTWSLIGDASLFGRGFGSFPFLMPAYQGHNMGGAVFQAHSDPLQALSEGGILALLVLLASGVFFAMRFESFRNDRLRAGLAVAGGAFALHSFVDFGSQIFGLIVPVVAILSASASVGRGGSGVLFGRSAARGLVLTMVLGGIWMGARTAAWAAIWRAPESGPLLMAAAEAAVTVYPEPRYRRIAASSYLELASKEPSGDHRRRALSALAETLRSWPLDARALSLTGQALSRFGRAADAAKFLESSKRAFHG